MRRLVLLPLLIFAVVIAIPMAFGDHPLRWGSMENGVVQAAGQVRESDWLAAITRADRSGSKQTADADQVAQVPVRWKKGAPQRGIQVYWKNDPKQSEDGVRRSAQRIVNYVVGLGADSMSISFPFYQDDLTASRVHDRATTPSPAHIGVLIRQAHLSGLRVSLRPILDEQSLGPPDGWRGNIAPKSPTEWFDSYRHFLAPYVAVAQNEGIATIVLGVELNSMQSKPQWVDLIRFVQVRFGGELAYDANWDRYIAASKAPPVNTLSVDAYFPAKVPDSASPQQIADVWNGWLDKRKGGDQPGLVFSEVGIGSRKGNFRKPNDYFTRGVYDPGIQPTWYDATCAVVRERKLGGIYFWKTDFNADPAKPTPIEQGHLDFTGYPLSEQAIRRCFTSL